MTLSPEQSPALTAEEWKAFAVKRDGMDAERFRDLFIGRPRGNIGVVIKAGQRDVWVSERPEDVHALAALCLYDQPFGFSQADLAAIHVVLTLGQVLNIPLGAPAKEQLGSLASRIQALLPPPS